MRQCDILLNFKLFSLFVYNTEPLVRKQIKNRNLFTNCAHKRNFNFMRISILIASGSNLNPIFSYYTIVGSANIESNSNYSVYVSSKNDFAMPVLLTIQNDQGFSTFQSTTVQPQSSGIVSFTVSIWKWYSFNGNRYILQFICPFSLEHCLQVNTNSSLLVQI